MKTKLTGQDYTNYRERILQGIAIRAKADKMEDEQNKILLPWLEERIKKCPIKSQIPKK